MSAPISQARAGAPFGAVRVSARHPRYLEGPDGRAFLPVGLNLCFVRFTPPAESLPTLDRWLDRLAGAGGNFARFWLGHPVFDVEPGALGVFDPGAAERLRHVLDGCARRGIAVKLTLDHFRFIEPRPVAEIFPGAASFARPAWHRSRGGPAETMDDFWQRSECRVAYLRRLDWLAAEFGGHPAVVAWELWNEVNACQGAGWPEWSRAMLLELQVRFPGTLTLQSLGSFDTETVVPHYRWLAELPGNQVVQAHRYLDPGAELPICRGPMDVLAADAMTRLRALAPRRPVLLAEGGAVEARHAGPSRLYDADSEGVLLHDVLFAPFFAGAAGPGQAWHWDFYVDRHDLWWHFARFGRAVEGFDPIVEQAEPEAWETEELRVHALRGRRTTLLWCRDQAADWRRELVDGEPAVRREGCRLGGLSWLVGADFAVRCYDPWADEWIPVPPVQGGITLPPFRRSCVVRIEAPPDQPAP